MYRYDYVFFDMDGTITDSEPGILQCIESVLIHNEIKYRKEDLHKMIGPPFRVSMRDFCGLSFDETEHFIDEYREMYGEVGWKNSKVYSGVEELLKRLKDAGIHLAVATSKPIFFTEKMLNYFNLSSYFDFVGAAVSDVSRDTKAAVVQWTIDNLNIKDLSRVIMVGDRLYDIEGARECGLDTIAVGWGYGNREEFEAHNAAYIIDTPKEVGDFLLKEN